ncbi:MAG: hypothetical protein CAF42_010545 [Nitrospira sp. CG24B]|nr:MAG: hypothetical protein CAF42_010545 [Nitrospira sp. CG24B]
MREGSCPFGDQCVDA